MIEYTVRNIFGVMIDLSPWIRPHGAFLDSDGDIEVEQWEALHIQLEQHVIYKRMFRSPRNSLNIELKLCDLLGVKILLCAEIIFIGCDSAPLDNGAWAENRKVHINYMNALWDEYVQYQSTLRSKNC